MHIHAACRTLLSLLTEPEPPLLLPVLSLTMIDFRFLVIVNNRFSLSIMDFRYH